MIFPDWQITYKFVKQYCVQRVLGVFIPIGEVLKINNLLSQNVQTFRNLLLAPILRSSHHYKSGQILSRKHFSKTDCILPLEVWTILQVIWDNCSVRSEAPSQYPRVKSQLSENQSNWKTWLSKVMEWRSPAMFLSERPPLRPYRLAEVCRCQLECREASSGRTSDTPLCELWVKWSVKV